MKVFRPSLLVLGAVVKAELGSSKLGRPALRSRDGIKDGKGVRKGVDSLKAVRTLLQNPEEE